MKQILISITAALISMTGAAQSTRNVTGVIIDGGDTAIIRSANIYLLSAKDSTVKRTTLAESSGSFTFENVKPGDYLISASSISHLKLFSRPFTISDTTTTLNVGILKLVKSTKDMKEVVLTSKKPFIERKIDRTIVNVDATISNAGNNALEVLEKSPGISVDREGNISYKGKNGVNVMIDGKPTQMSAADLSNMLRNMPAANIDQIELMSNPSAKFDAAGNAGIINIKTKKLKQTGFNGSLNSMYSQGYYPRFNQGINLNYKKGKLNAFTNLSAGKRTNRKELELKRDYYYQSPTPINFFEQTATGKRSSLNLSAKTGIDYNFNKKTSIGVVLTGNLIPRTETTFNHTGIFNAAHQLDSTMTTATDYERTWANFGSNVNFRHRFDSAEREITADVDYLFYNSTQEQDIRTQSYYNNGNLKSIEHLYGDLPSHIHVLTSKVDYTQQLPGKIKLETGLKYSAVITENLANYFIVDAPAKNIDYNRSNSFDYEENIGAGYINFSKQIKKWGVQAGLRAENTAYSGKVYGNPQRKDSSFTNNYTGVFPTLFLSYSQNEKNNWSFNYGRRISRPDYQSLNPFIYYIDPYTRGGGNPYLRPSYSHVFELSHSYKNWLNTTLNYSYDKDIIQSYFKQDSLVSTQMPGNYGRRQNLSLGANAQLSVKKWYTFAGGFQAAYQNYRASLNGKEINMGIKSFSFQGQNQFNLGKNWSAEISGFYGAGFNEGVLLIDPLWQVNTGLSKKILKGKGNLKFAVTDIFNSGNAKGTGDFQVAKAFFTEKSDRQAATISFSYRFGKPIKTAPPRKTGSASEEEGRIKM